MSDWTGRETPDPHDLLNSPEPEELVLRRIASRDVLAPRMRMVIALSALVSLNRVDEFESSVRTALAEGLTREEITEVLLELADVGVRIPTRAFDLVRS
jgi:alkylhydroperoxidase/carboxymuconolactone decarboxylase family protein YurZ